MEIFVFLWYDDGIHKFDKICVGIQVNQNRRRKQDESNYNRFGLDFAPYRQDGVGIYEDDTKKVS